MAAAAIIQTETLNDIADAIIAKGGAAGPLTPIEMPAAIENIKTKSDVLHRSDANFYDSDGTLLFAFTKEEIAELEELPTPPERELLTFDIWTHTLAEIKSTVVTYGGFVEVGAIYKTVDGDTKIKVRLGEHDRRFVMRLFVPAGERVVVRWDETSPLDMDVLEPTSAETFTVMHDYTDTASTHVISVGGGEHYYTNLPLHSSLLSPRTAVKVEAIYFGEDSGVVTRDPFEGHYSLKDLVLPQGFKYKTGTKADGSLIPTTGLVNGCAVEHVNIPPGFTWESTNSLFTAPDGGLTSSSCVPTYTLPFSNTVKFPCYQPRLPFSRPAYVSLPPSSLTVSISENMFVNAYNLREVQLGGLPTITGAYAFYNCNTLQRVSTASAFPDGNEMLIPNVQSTNTFFMCQSLTEVPPINSTTLPQRTFAYCTSLPRVQLRNTTFIAGEAFYGCTNLQEVDLTECSPAVTVASTAFSAVNPGEFDNRTITIKVPSSLVSTYEAATDWKAAATAGGVTFVFQGV